MGGAVAAIEQGDIGSKSTVATRARAKKSRSDIPTISEAAARSFSSKGSFACPIVIVIEEDEDPHLWQTPQEEADYRLALSLARPVRERTATNRYQPEPSAVRNRRSATVVSEMLLPPPLVMLETSFRLDTISPREEWRFEQHLYANTSGVNHHVGMGLYLGTDIPEGGLV